MKFLFFGLWIRLFYLFFRLFCCE